MKSKKIGLLTLPLIDNYGGIIQLAALNKYLESEGYEVFHLNKRYEVSLLKRAVRRILKGNPLYFVFDFKDHAKKHRYIKKLNDFINKELSNSTKELYTSQGLRKAVNDLQLDAVIVGSDQVWRMLYIKENYKDYFLSFINSKNIKKISYAASFGTDTWENQGNITDVSKLLKDFTAISVREDTGVGMCKNTFDIKKAKHVLDPTFLPNLDYYESIIKREYRVTKKIGLFNYVLDRSPSKLEIINSVAQQLNLSVDSIYLENNLNDYLRTNKLKPSIGEWLYHFKNADFIITDSFHGTVFSIIYNKQFIAIGNKGRGVSRFTSLLNSLGLLNRLVLDEKNRHLSIIKSPIDYAIVNKKIEQLKQQSINFILNSLS